MVLSTNTNIFAQILDQIGINAGGSFATQTSAYEGKNRSQRDCILAGINIIAQMDLGINKVFSINLDVGYIKKGYHYKVSKTSSTKTYEQRLHYITFSPQIKFGKEIGKLRPSAILGPRVDYMIDYYGVQKIDSISKNFPTSVFGISAGIDVTYKLGRIGLKILYLYQFDFTNLLPSSAPDDLKYKNKAMLLNLGVVYFLDKNNIKDL